MIKYKRKIKIPNKTSSVGLYLKVRNTTKLLIVQTRYRPNKIKTKRNLI